ncbi:MAG: TolC family protein [Flavobacteriaceae bacterium]|nr:TolC family protein [Flavobacteriaceae bacterium]
MKVKITLMLIIINISFSYAQKKWTLKECVDYALENNLTIKRTVQTNLLIDEDLIIAKNNRLPNVSGSASQNFNFGSNFNPVTNSRDNAANRATSFGINASVVLFDGFSIKNGLLRAEKNREISKYDLEKMKNDISLNIVNSYLNILFQKESLKVAESNLEITEKSLKRTQELINAGTQPKGNLLEIEATKSNDENAIVIAQNDIDLALLSLSQILQISNTDFDIKEIEIKLNNLKLNYNNTEEIFNVSVQNQPEIKSAELSIENTATNIKIAKGNFLPTVSLSGNLSTIYSHIQGRDDDFYVPDINNPLGPQILVKNGIFEQFDNNFGQFFGLNVSIPIYSRGQIKSDVNKAKINQEIAKTDLEDQKRALREDIERAYINAKATLKEYEAAKKSLEAQELSFDFAQERYKIGATNSFDFEQVRTRLINAKSNVIRAKYSYVFRTKLLEFYYGIPIVIE